MVFAHKALWPLLVSALALQGACPAPQQTSSGADSGALDEGAADDSAMDRGASPADVHGDHHDAPDLPAMAVVPWPESSCVVFDPATDDPTEALFAPGCVVDVDVTMAPTDWYALRHQTRTYIDVLAGDCMGSPPQEVFSWFPAQVKVGDQVVAGVGIRKKGFLGSLSVDKPSLKIRFDRYVEQRLSGMKRMTLNNMQQDAGLITACLAYGVMRDAGLPAPRCNFARVRVNDVDLGVYAHVESIKSAFLQRNFGSSGGNHYEGTISDFRDGFLDTWEKKTHIAQDDWSDVDAAALALETDDEQLLEAAAQVFDLGAFYTFWAAEVLLAHWDGYAGNTNNFHIYRDPIAGDGRFRFIPWGVDAAFENIPELAGEGVLIPQSVLAFGHLANRLYGVEAGRDAYHAALQGLLEGPWSEAALVAEVDRMESLLEPHLSSAERAAMSQKLSFRRAWIQARRGQLLGELQPTPPAWEPPAREPVCWPVAGSVSVTFSTTWGSSGFDPLTSSGTVEASVTGVGPLGNVSCTARVGTAEGEVGEAVIEVIAQGAGDSYFLARIVGPVGAVAANASAPIDWREFRGYLGYFIPLANEFSAFGLLYGGSVSFDEATTVPGGSVTGSFQADVVLAPL